MGVTSGSPAHLVGDPYARKVYITEGLLKADVAHCLSQRTFAAIAGINNQKALEGLLSMLRDNGTEVIVEAADMDKFSNPAVYKGMHNLLSLARSKGMQTLSMTWNPNFKGIDDWLLSLKADAKEEDCTLQAAPLPLSQYKRVNYRIYQLRLGQALPPIPFAFQGIKKLQKAGYTQPPAALYQLVHDDDFLCRNGLSEADVLLQLSKTYARIVGTDHSGRYIAASDVIELYDEQARRYYYCDAKDRFIRVRFSPALSTPLKKAA